MWGRACALFLVQFACLVFSSSSLSNLATSHGCPCYKSRLPLLQVTPALATSHACPCYKSRLPLLPVTPALATGHACPCYQSGLPLLQVTPALATSHACLCYRSRLPLLPVRPALATRMLRWSTVLDQNYIIFELPSCIFEKTFVHMILRLCAM